MKIAGLYSRLLIIIVLPALSGCEYLGIGKKWNEGCTYNFLQCTTGKIERTYKNHRAMVIRSTDNNALPSPYDKEFYRINLDPDKKFPKESSIMYVIPCSDLPEKYRKDSLVVTVSGDQLSCRHLTVNMPNARLVGNAVFNLKSIK